MAQHLALKPVFERRIPLRLLAYWEKLRNGRPMPAEADVKAEDIQDVWDNCFLMRVKDLKPRLPRYHYMGKEIIRAWRGEGSHDGADELVTPQPGMVDAYRMVIESRKPLVENGEFTNSNNQIVKYRQCLMPLGEGDKVQAIFGALHLRVFPTNN